MTPTQEQLLARIAPDEVAFWRTLGIEVVGADEGMARLRIPARAELETRRPDTLHGGVLASLIDAAGSAALLTTRAEDDETWAGFASTDLNVSYLAAATSDVTAEARVLRGGRTVVYTTVEVTDAAGTTVAVGRVTYMIVRRRQS
ncbi:MAG: PaaI family thioesterase [Chloroflexi bacterium]|nr:PaaI family thioesterase [Chloroflexota bacterium]